MQPARGNPPLPHLRAGRGWGRGGSTHIHNALRIGDQVQISPPRNHFPLGQAPKTVLLAGGIGVTPLLAMAETLSNRGQDFELHCFSSSTDRLALAAYIATRPLAGRTQFHVGGQASPSRAAIPATMAGHPAGTEFYVCGPAGFIETIIKHAVAAGIDPALLHSERFAPEPVRPPGAKDRPFTVRIHGSGNTYPVPPEKTIAEVLLEQGLPLTLSCNQGMCGTCLTPVLAGTPEHRDTIQTPEEKASNNEIALCCSRASSQEITLQL